MQEAWLRRDGDHRSSVVQQNWLPKLQVPVSQSEFLPFVGGDPEIGALHVLDDVRGIGRPAAARCFADHAARGPGLHIERRHPAMGQVDEAILKLRATQDSLLELQETGRKPADPTTGRASQVRYGR